VSAPALDLPRWAYLPGTTPEPDRAPLEHAKALVPKAYENGVDPRDPAFRYGLALHDAGLFWEAHEVWEAVWKAAPKNGCDRLLLRGLIQRANAHLKLRMGRPAAALRLLDEAAGELAEAARRRGAVDLGLLSGTDLKPILDDIRAVRGELGAALDRQPP
jgi:tetratricopeptide (TPR) repeat protein